MEEPSPRDANAADRPSGKKRSRTRWGPNKDGHAAQHEPEQPGEPAPLPSGKDQEDASKRRKKSRWGPGDVKLQAQQAPGSNEAQGGAQEVKCCSLARLSLPECRSQAS